jgi:pancreatic triacylglycerol lipase
VSSSPLTKQHEYTHRWVRVPDEDGKLHIVDLNSLEQEPQPVYDPMTDIVFRLFTRTNPTQAQIITFDMNTVRNSNWNAAHGVRVLIHGWNGGAGSSGTLTREFLARDDYNVIAVDWGAGAQTPNYLAARNRVGPTGNAIAVLIDALQEAGLTDFSRVNVVGHSLG